MTAAPIFGFMPARLDLDAVASLIGRPCPAPGPNLVVTPNLDHIVQLQRNDAFRAAYRRAALILCDGFPVQYYARLRGHAAPRVTGSDLIARLMAQPQAASMVFVVDRPETAQAVERWAAGQPDAPCVTAIVPPASFIDDRTACADLARAITLARPTLLVMAVGAPQSEIFIDRYRAALPDCWAVCVGQGVRMALGLTRRAPPALRRLHAEWLWRLAQEPRRLGARYGLGAFRFGAAIAADLRGARP